MQKLSSVCGVFAIILIACSVGWTQTGTSIRGTVSDPKNLVIEGASVYLENIGTKAVTRTTTDVTGGYQFLEVTPGTYNIRAEHMGFKSVVFENLSLFVNTPTTLFLNFTEIGPFSEKIVVSGTAPAINAVDATVGNTIEFSQIDRLPLPELNVAEVINLQAGVVVTGIQDRILPDTRGGSVNGGRSDQSNITLDGADVNDQQTGEAFKSVLPITSDSIQELRMVTANATTIQGRSSAGQVSVVTRSGTNEFHGSAYENHRNTVTAANSFFNNSTIDPVTGKSLERPKLIRNIFGASLGGPVKKDRLFFFFNFEDAITRKEEPQLRIVPSPTLRQGTLRFLDDSGNVQSVSSSELKTMDPLDIGVNTAVLDLFRQYPVGNDPTQGGDGGLNFTGFRFNAPINEDKPSYIGRIDYISPNNTDRIFVRGSLADFNEDARAQQFPGQSSSQVLLTNSKGTAIGYTRTFSSKLVNVVRWGYTQQDLDFTKGNTSQGFRLQNLADVQDFDARNNSRKIPTHNLTEDLSWVKGRHTLQFGVNYRNIHNKRSTEEKTYPFYQSNSGLMNNFGRNVLPAGISPDFESQYVVAQMALFGTISQTDVTYFVNRDGNYFPSPHVPHREFISNEFEWYAEDQWKLPGHVTLSAGIRYSYFAPPWEKNGLEVRPDFDVNAWFAKRRDGGALGIPSNANPLLSFVPGGKANKAASYFDPDKNNFAPRFAVAWSPSFSSGLLHTIFGSLGQSSIRFGGSMFYDRTGGMFPVTVDLSGAVGLATSMTTEAGSVDYDTAPRFSGLQNLGSIPLPTPGPAGFPATLESAGNIGFMVDSKLRTPYSTTFNFSISRELPANIAVEVAYVGRIGRKLLIQSDFAAPLVNFKDPKSGQTWIQAAGIVADMIDRGVPTEQVPEIPFIENVFAPLAVGGSTATQSFYDTALLFAPSWTDVLHALDNTTDPSTIYGQHTFFQQQFDWLPTWTNLGKSNYHSLQVMVRRRFGGSFQADFNYTLAKSLDNGSAVESEGQGAGQLLNAFDPHQSYAPSNFDVRHQINSNFLVDLPIGRGRHYGAGMNSVLNGFFGGWSVSGVVRWRTGFPFAPGSGNGVFAYPTNFGINGPPTLKPGAALPEIKVTKDAPGGPNIFADPEKAYDAFEHTRSGFSGSRNVLHGPGFFTLDTGVQKSFKIAEHQQIQFRWETFNAMNTVNFDGRVYDRWGQGIDFSLDSKLSFGQLRSLAGSPRSMQFALRYQF